tara:strand:+ start:3238 stop:3687 length:450 start_codon:yes stop_codon:yes gene_type:complete
MVKKGFKSYIVQVLAVILLVACTPQKRMNRLIKKFPHLTETKIDTIRIIDTFVIQQYDTTLINNVIKQDCVIVINNERLKISYKYDTIKEQIIHSIKLPNDTIYKEKIIPIEVEKVVYKEISWWEKYQTLIYIGLALFVLSIIYKRLTK